MKRALFCLAAAFGVGALAYCAGVRLPYMFVAFAAAFTIAMEATG